MCLDNIFHMLQIINISVILDYIPFCVCVCEVSLCKSTYSDTLRHIIFELEFK